MKDLSIEAIVDKRDTRELILDVAVELFSKRSFSNVSIRDICEAASVTPPTIYHYFGNKDQLFEAVILKKLNLADFITSLRKVVEAETDPELKLKAFIQHYLESFPREFFNPGLFLQSTTQLYRVSAQRVLSEFATINSMADDIIQDGIRTGHFRTLRQDQIMTFLMNLLMSYVLGEVHYFQSHEPLEATDFLFDLVMNGLKPD